MSVESNPNPEEPDIQHLDYAPPHVRRPPREGQDVESFVALLVTGIILIISVLLAIAMLRGR